MQVLKHRQEHNDLEIHLVTVSGYLRKDSKSLTNWQILPDKEKGSK